jgi:hypothetical protein
MAVLEERKRRNMERGPGGWLATETDAGTSQMYYVLSGTKGHNNSSNNNKENRNHLKIIQKMLKKHTKKGQSQRTMEPEGS